MSLTPEQLEQRRHFIGGSEVSAILDLNPFASPIDVYLAKVEGYMREATPDMERGTFLEDGVARWYAARTGTELREVGTLRHPSRPRIGCTPDRIFNNALGESRLLSIKVPGNWLSEEWGEPHNWRVPTGYFLQLQYEMAVCDALGLCRTDWAHLAAPLNGDLQILTVAGEPEIQRRMMEEAEAWWVKHVERRVPPPLDGSESAKQWLRRRFPTSNSPVRKATAQEDLLALQLQLAEVAWEAADDAYEKARQPVEEAIGTAEGIEGAFGRITFRSDARGRRALKPTWTTKIGEPS